MRAPFRLFTRNVGPGNLGAQGVTVRELEVRGVHAGSLAEEAGVKLGTIISVDGKEVKVVHTYNEHVFRDECLNA